MQAACSIRSQLIDEVILESIGRFNDIIGHSLSVYSDGIWRQVEANILVFLHLSGHSRVTSLHSQP